MLQGGPERRYLHITLDVTNNEEEFFVLVMQEVFASEAQIQIELLKEIMDYISTINNKDMTTFSVVKNLGYCNT